MSHRTWKAHERRKCRDLGGERKPQISEQGYATGSDGVGLPVSLECKYTARYQLRRSWIEQARRNGKDERKPWVIALDEHNDHSSGLAVMPWPFFVELMYAAGRIPLAASGGSGPRVTTGARSSA